MRLIDADAYAAEMAKRQDACGKWMDSAIDELTLQRAEGAYTMLCEAKLTLDEMPTIPAPRWVRCEERLPDDTRDVLAVRRYGENMDKQEVLVAHLSVIMSMEHGVDKWWNATNITHWMDFPEPPKEEE